VDHRGVLTTVGRLGLELGLWLWLGFWLTHLLLVDCSVVIVLNSEREFGRLLCIKSHNFVSFV